MVIALFVVVVVVVVVVVGDGGEKECAENIVVDVHQKSNCTTMLQLPVDETVVQRLVPPIVNVVLFAP
jgi:hypothetical protein